MTLKITDKDGNTFVVEGTIEETKEEPKRWRAEEGQSYYAVFVNDNGIDVVDYYERGDGVDNGLHNYNNYFQTTKQAEEMAEKIRKLFKDGN